MQSFENKVVVVTGGGTGIGRSLARRFCERGAKVVIGGRHIAPVETTVTELREAGYEAAGTRCDVTDEASVYALRDFAADSYGAADVLVNNAGIGQEPVPLLEQDLDQFRKIYEVNVFGVVHCTRAFLPAMIAKGTPCAIYNVGSENSLATFVPSAHAYVSSKHAVLAITELLREELPQSIEVGLICPGYVNSEMTAAGPPGMDTDEYTAIAIRQMELGKFFVVSHGYNVVRIEERYLAIRDAYREFAPRKPGDEALDVRHMIARLQKGS